MADKYIVSKEELTSLAEAIRTKTGKADNLAFPHGMISEIEGITGGGGEILLKPGDYTDYTKRKALELANVVNSIKKDDSIVSLCMSDSHFHSAADEYKNSRGSATQSLEVIKALSYFLPIDFIAHLGDVGCEDEVGYATLESVQDTSTELISMLKEACGDSIPLFVAIGNHDAGDYMLHNKYFSLKSSANATATTTAQIEAKKTAQQNLNKLVAKLQANYPDVLPAGSVESSYDSTTGETVNRIIDETRLNVLFNRMSSYLYNNFTKLSDSDKTAIGSESRGGYLCRDLEDKKVKVFLLNTLEKSLDRSTSALVSAEQANWVVSEINKLNEKNDAEEWGFIILCHYPLDYSDVKTQLSNKLYTYVTGKKLDGTDDTATFQNGRKAKFLCQFHGHTHNFLYDKLHYGSTVPAQDSAIPSEQYDAIRVATPSTECGRENDYWHKTSVDGTMWGIKFFEGNYNNTSTKPTTVHPVTKEPVTIHKNGGENETAFVVNIVTPSRKTIHSLCFGIGYDRELTYDFSKTQYTVSFNLENMDKLPGTPTVALSGDSYSATLSAAEGYKLSSAQVEVKMNNQVQPNAFDSSTGVVTIDPVTGPIVITGKATEASYFTVTYQTTAITLSNTKETVDNDGTGYYNVLTPTSGLLINPYLTKITMGGVDIPSEYISKLGDGYEVNIPKVTGPIVINASAARSNLWQFAESLENSSIMADDNGNIVGYKDNKRLSTSSPYFSTQAGYVSTGWIPYTVTAGKLPKTIEIHGVSLDTTSYCRMYCNGSNKDAHVVPYIAQGSSTAFADVFDIEDLSDGGFKLVPKDDGAGSWVATKASVIQYFKISLKGNGKDFVLNLIDTPQ